VLPSRKVTVPVAALGAVVAVSVTLAPTTGVVLDEVSTVAVADATATGFTTMLLITKPGDGEKNPTWVLPSRLDGMVPESVWPLHEMVAVDPVNVTVRGAAGVFVQITAT